MPKLITQDNLKLRQPKVVPVNAGATVLSALKSEFSNLDPQLNKIYLNTALLLPTDPQLHDKLKESDVITVVQETKGTVKKVLGSFVDPLLSIADSLVGDAFNSLIDIPDVDTERSSSNNDFTSQTNVMRAFSLFPIVVGSPEISPDLASEAIEFYSNNVKQSEQSFICSYGTFTGGVIRAGNTPVTRFPGAVATRYEPDPVTKITTIPDYRIGKSVDEVDGQILDGTNEGQEGTAYQVDKDTPEMTISGSSVCTAYITDNALAQSLLTAVNDGATAFTLEYRIFKTIEPQGAPEPIQATGSGTLSEMTDTGNGTYKVVLNGFTGPQSETTTYPTATLTYITLVGGALGPFANPIQCEKMFFNIKFDRGLKNTVPFEVVVYELDGLAGSRTGFSQTFNVAYTRDTLDATYFTFEVNPTAGRSWYEFTIERTNESKEDTSEPDEATLEKVFCIQELGDYDFYNLTMLTVQMPTTQIPTGSGVDTKINIKDGSQNMPSYDLDTKQITSDAPSRSFADAILYLWRDFLEKDVSLLNLDELYTIEKNLIDTYGEEFTYFDYTYDDVEMSAGERIDLALNVVRGARYSDGNQIRFWRDEATDINSTLISRADVVSESERDYTLTRSNYVNGEFDSVQVEYVDRTLNKKAYVYRSIDNGVIVDVTGSNPRKITLTGCQSKAVADNRADLEIRKSLYQRWTLTDTVRDVHRFLDKGEVVLYNEIYEGGDIFGGDIVAANGATYKTSGELSLDSGKTYQAYFTNLYGDIVGPLSVTGSTDKTVTIDAANSEIYVRGFENAQLGSRYLITEINDTTKRRYRVVEKTTSGYNVQLSLINYDERIYENDL